MSATLAFRHLHNLNKNYIYLWFKHDIPKQLTQDEPGALSRTFSVSLDGDSKSTFLYGVKAVSVLISPVWESGTLSTKSLRLCLGLTASTDGLRKKLPTVKINFL